MGNRIQRQDSWDVNERGSDYRLKYRSWRQGEAEGGPFNTPSSSHAERERAVSIAPRTIPSFNLEETNFLSSAQLEGWLPPGNLVATRSQSANVQGNKPRTSLTMSLSTTLPQFSKRRASNDSSPVTVFPPEAVPSDSQKTTAPSVNEMILEELAKTISDELVGPEFTSIAKPAVSPPPLSAAASSASAGAKNPVRLSTVGETHVLFGGEEMKEEEPRVKMVVNHLYQPVLAKVKEHLISLPEWYTAKTPPKELARHIRTLLEARREGVNKVAVSATPMYDASRRLVPGYFVVVVCAKDRRQLLDAITRCVSTRASISEATIVTTGDGFALDRFVLSLRPDDPDRSLFDDLENFAQYLKTDIEEVLEVTPESPVLSPYPQQNGRARTSSAHKRKSSNTSSISLESNSGIVNKDSNGLPLTTRGGGASAGGGDQGTSGRFEVPFQEIRLIRVLGEGRTGKTYLSEWSGSRVAAKVMNIDDINGGGGGGGSTGKRISKSNLSEFRRELHLVSKLSHPNIVKFVGASARPPRYILLFELCEGGDLASLIRQKDQKYSCFQIALDVANGLAFLHRNHIIHRDVKPENIMLDKQGRAKVADFGLSCYVSGAAAEFTAETGTYRFMAPEVMRHERYSFPADVYSFSLVCYALITRRAPFDDYTPLQAAMAVARQDTRPKLPTNLPKPLTELIARCWLKDPQLRPDFEEVVDELSLIREHLNNRSRKLLDWGFVIKKKKSSASPFASVSSSLAPTAM